MHINKYVRRNSDSDLVLEDTVGVAVEDGNKLGVLLDVDEGEEGDRVAHAWPELGGAELEQDGVLLTEELDVTTVVGLAGRVHVGLTALDGDVVSVDGDVRDVLVSLALLFLDVSLEAHGLEWISRFRLGQDRTSIS